MGNVGCDIWEKWVGARKKNTFNAVAFSQISLRAACLRSQKARE